MDMLIFFLGTFGTIISVSQPLLTRCTARITDMVSFHCPRRMVIYQTQIALGVSPKNLCSRGNGDQVGTTAELSAQRDECYWQNTCKIRWNTNSPIVTSCKSLVTSAFGVGKSSYVTYDRPKCIRKRSVFDICSVNNDISKSYEGVIRSDAHYPRGYANLRGDTCIVRIKPRPRHHLKVQIILVNLQDNDLLRVQTFNPDRTLLETTDGEDKTYVVNTGYVEISFFMSQNTTNGGKGFTIYYENVKNDAVFPVPEEYYISPRRHPSKQSAKYESSVSEELTRSELLTVSCPAGQVINKLTMFAGRGRAWKRSDVTKCQGRYTSLITSINNCYWKRSCMVKKSPREPLTAISPEGCLGDLGRRPDFISVQKQQCIPKENVIDMCDHSFKIIRVNEGIIKSHSNYPWHYKSRRTICRKKIRVDRMNGLRLFTESIDLDTGTRGDNVKFYHHAGRKTLIRKLVGQQEVEIEIKSGILEIVFRISRKSIAGQGFILRFEPLVKQYGKMHLSDVPEYPPGDISAIAVARRRRKPCTRNNQNSIRAIIFQEGKKVKIPGSVLCKRRRQARRRKKIDDKRPVMSSKMLDILRKVSTGSESSKKGRSFLDINWAFISD